MSIINSSIRSAPVSVDDILSNVSQMTVRQQSKDAGQSRKTMAKQSKKSEQNRQETRALENQARKLGKDLREHNTKDRGWFKSFVGWAFGGTERKAARLNGKIQNKAADVKEKEADLDNIKRQNQDQLASMKTKIESFDNVFKALNASMNSQAQSNQYLSDNIKQ